MLFAPNEHFRNHNQESLSKGAFGGNCAREKSEPANYKASSHSAPYFL